MALAPTTFPIWHSPDLWQSVWVIFFHDGIVGEGSSSTSFKRVNEGDANTPSVGLVKGGVCQMSFISDRVN